METLLVDIVLGFVARAQKRTVNVDDWLRTTGGKVDSAGIHILNYSYPKAKEHGDPKILDAAEVDLRDAYNQHVVLGKQTRDSKTELEKSNDGLPDFVVPWNKKCSALIADITTMNTLRERNTKEFLELGGKLKKAQADLQKMKSAVPA